MQSDELVKENARLQAEVEHLHNLHQIEQKRAGSNATRANDLQSELTKARELLREWLTSNFTGSCPERNDLRCRTDYALSNQSAPADKGQDDCAHSEANKHGCPECGEEFKP